MTREEELKAIDAAIAEGRVRKVEYTNHEPPKPRRLPPLNPFNAGERNATKFRERQYAKRGLL